MHSEGRRSCLLHNKTDTIWCKYYQRLLQCYVFIDVSHKKKLFYKLAMGSVIFHETGKFSVDSLYCIFNIYVRYSVSRVYALFFMSGFFLRAEIYLLKYYTR